MDLGQTDEVVEHRHIHTCRAKAEDLSTSGCLATLSSGGEIA